jgi:predicted alpha/beta-fold hydrolase
VADLHPANPRRAKPGSERRHSRLAGGLGCRGVVVVGFALTGNISLKFAAEYCAKSPLRALATISALIDLAVTSANMLRRHNTLYNRNLLRDFCRE